jgi:predicted RNA-binding Zn ribbon-like protein
MPLTPETIHLWGDTLCLDYANSVVWSPANDHLNPSETDVLRTGDMLLRWARRVGLLSDEAQSAPGAELRRVRALRDSIHGLFVSISHDQQPAVEDTALLLNNYTEAANEATLGGDGLHYQLHWSSEDPRRVRYAVAFDALGLLLDPQRLRRVTHCPGRDCGWLFLNASGRRRWCSMSTCGSREKMRSHYQRRQETR